MKEIKNYFIIDLKTKKVLYGYAERSLVFSNYETANEIASQLFEKTEEFMIIEIPDFKR